LRVEGVKSGATVITVDAKGGENTIVYAPGSNAKVSVEYINQNDVKQAICGASVLGLCLESPMETVTAAAKIARAAGVKV
ncbi:ribokinase, partial [Gardnerella leopoldii]|nr:ribokinase [Gardnerella leopoldii]